jgi:hypothetical protein
VQQHQEVQHSTELEITGNFSKMCRQRGGNISPKEESERWQYVTKEEIE